jgi:hypothetical protein
MVTHTRWTSVSGEVFNSFRDLLVLATQSLPRNHAEHLQPWDLAHLVPYSDEYLSGMSCQSYQVDLNQGFETAKQMMAPVIKQTIARDIGGDHQEISTSNSRFADIFFRHLLLTLWISAYHYNNRSYRFLINARSGAVRGERPYSAVKIAVFVAAIVLAIVVLCLLLSHHAH